MVNFLFTTIDGHDICHPPIVMVRVDGSITAKYKIIKEGSDPSIIEIETYL